MRILHSHLLDCHSSCPFSHPKGRRLEFLFAWCLLTAQWELESSRKLTPPTLQKQSLKEQATSSKSKSENEASLLTRVVLERASALRNVGTQKLADSCAWDSVQIDSKHVPLFMEADESVSWTHRYVRTKNLVVLLLLHSTLCSVAIQSVESWDSVGCRTLLP